MGLSQVLNAILQNLFFFRRLKVLKEKRLFAIIKQKEVFVNEGLIIRKKGAKNYGYGKCDSRTIRRPYIGY